MSADLHIHVLEGVEERDIAILESSSLGSKYSSLFNHHTTEQYDAAYDKIGNSPNIWIGSVSWLKAGLLDDYDRYVPSTVEEISNLIGEDLPTLDEELIAKIVKAFDLPNNTSYELAERNAVREFLEKHKGKKVFTVSW